MRALNLGRAAWHDGSSGRHAIRYRNRTKPYPPVERGSHSSNSQQSHLTFDPAIFIARSPEGRSRRGWEHALSMKCDQGRKVADRGKR